MNARTRIEGSINDKCLLDLTEGMFFTGMGKKIFTEYCEQIGAVRRFGRRTLYHRETIENALRGSTQDPGKGAD